MVFNRRGHRYKEGYGLTYKCSNNDDYTVYYGDFCAGIDITSMSLRWLAIYKRQTIIGRHSKRSVAEKTCQKHAAQMAKAPAPKPKRKPKLTTDGDED